MNNLLSFSKSFCLPSVDWAFFNHWAISNPEILIPCTINRFYFACQHCDKEWSRINFPHYEWTHFCTTTITKDSNYSSETSASLAFYELDPPWLKLRALKPIKNKVHWLFKTRVMVKFYSKDGWSNRNLLCRFLEERRSHWQMAIVLGDAECFRALLSIGKNGRGTQ